MAECAAPSSILYQISSARLKIYNLRGCIFREKHGEENIFFAFQYLKIKLIDNFKLSFRLEQKFALLLIDSGSGLQLSMCDDDKF